MNMRLTMKRTKSNRILLLESLNFSSLRIAGKYEKRYIYSGSFHRAEKLPYDFVDRIDYYLSHHRAGKVIDEVYTRYVKKNEAEILNEIMDDERAHFFIKKTMLSALARLFLSFILAENFIKRYKIEETIDFIPCEFPYTLYQIISEKRDLLPDKVNIPLWYLNRMKRREFIKNTAYCLAFILYPLALSLCMRIGWSKNTGKRSYRYGIYILDSWVSSYSPQCMYFLENKDGVNRKSTLYIMDSKISKTNLREIKATGYHCCYFKKMLRQFSIWKYFRKIYPGIRRNAKRMNSIKSDRILLTESYLKTLRRYILWEMFYSRYNVKTFLAVQSPGDIPRVLFQKRHSSRNIFIYISSNYSPVYWDDVTAYIDLHYGFMIYDTMISSCISNDFFKKNNNFIGRYINCGTLRSDVVFKIKHDTGLKAKVKKELGVPANKTIIGFFDEPPGKTGAFFNDREAYKAVNDVYRILQSNEKYYVIYRTRGRDRFSENGNVKKGVDRLIAHERVFYANKLTPHYKAYDLMGVCDLVIGCFNSSVTQESVAGGIRTICHIPSERFAKDIFTINTFPRFCALGYEQLKEYTEYWLNQCSEDDFRNFQDTYIKGYLDNYCDGKATKRLQLALEKL